VRCRGREDERVDDVDRAPLRLRKLKLAERLHHAAHERLVRHSRGHLDAPRAARSRPWPLGARSPRGRLLGSRGLQRRDVSRDACRATPEGVSERCDEYTPDHAQTEQHDGSREGPIRPSAWAAAYGLVRAIRRHVDHRVLHQCDDRMGGQAVWQRARLVRRRPRRGDLRDRCPVLWRLWRDHRRRFSTAWRGKRLRLFAGAQGCIRHSERLADLHQRGLGIADGAGARRHRSGGF
jgi:hypothetical protein